VEPIRVLLVFGTRPEAIKMAPVHRALSADPRFHAEKMLTKIESILEGKADSDVSSYSIAGRSLTKFSPEELIQWRDYYRKEVALHKREEAIKHGRRPKSTILMRF